MKGFNRQYKHELHTIKLHGKTAQVLYPVYKETQKKNIKPNILTKVEK